MNPKIDFYIINEIKEMLKNSNKSFDIEIAVYFIEKETRSDFNRNETDVNNLYIQTNLNKCEQSKRVQCVNFYSFHNR